jgi:hypothetical protein
MKMTSTDHTVAEYVLRAALREIYRKQQAGEEFDPVTALGQMANDHHAARHGNRSAREAIKQRLYDCS